MPCEFRVRARGRVAVACDAAGGTAGELCVVEFVRAERLPTVAVPGRGSGHATRPLGDPRLAGPSIV
jgi:hypothetical protein